MSLKIFISSVYRELAEERRALQEETQKLQDLFVGMETFGSDPNKPADYCVRKVEESDLYVGLFGDDYGSTDEATDKSFTQLEYEAAIAKHIPCLIYFKGSITDNSATDERLIPLKERLRKDHIVAPFEDIYDLKLKFFRGFIKVLREELFDKLIPASRGSIPADILSSLTKELIQEQIKSVGQDKYISDVYVTREAEKEIERFLHFEEMFRTRSETILQCLDLICTRYGLGDEARLMVSHMKLASENIRGESLRAVDELKHAFYFQEVEEAIIVFNSLIMEYADDCFDARADELVRRWRGTPFVDQAKLPQLKIDLSEVRRRSLTKQVLQTDLPYRKSLQLFPSYEEDSVTIHLANDLLKELTRLIEMGLKRCLVLVDKAGRGKTNVACHVAEQLVETHPVILLSGQMELSTEYDIEFHIQQRLESAFSGIFSDWMNRVSSSLQKSRKWLFIIIDGINENSRRPLFNQLLKGLLARLEERRIKIILTCRDLFWDVFRGTIEPYLFENPVPLHEFTEAEWHQAVEVYFNRFNIECSLDKEAREELKNPLLLRFFCEAHRDQQLGKVTNLRLLSVFNFYVKRIGQSISERDVSLKADAALELLLSVARKMWEQRSISVSLATAGISQQESSESTSVYNLVLSENIIFEETRHTYSTRKSIRFLYDEFMEYMIARSWVEDISDAADERPAVGRLLQQAVESLGSFPPALGAVLFLDKMLERGGGLVNDFIKRALKFGDSFLNSQQTSLVYAFESINFAAADDELIMAVEKFEPTVREELRERLASVILKILEANPDHRYAKKYVHQVLEVDNKNRATSTQDTTGGAIGGQYTGAKPDKLREQLPFGSDGTAAIGKRLDSESAEKKDEVPRLPPGRYHYSEETKINAIGILVQMKDNREYEVIEEGIRKLGRTDLHSALQALEHLDLAGNEMVYRAVANYIKVSQPEYRIYCAWLLRKRYGKEPANYMVQLLTDRETRVHQYAAGLFERRIIEGELIEGILWQLRNKGAELKPWHLNHFIKLLAKKAAFYSKDLEEAYGKLIVNVLKDLLNHRQASIRLELYRAITAYPSFIGLEVVKEIMQRDSDIYIRSQADKLARHA